MHMASTRQNGHMAYSDTQILGSVPKKKTLVPKKPLSVMICLMPFCTRWAQNPVANGVVKPLWMFLIKRRNWGYFTSLHRGFSLITGRYGQIVDSNLPPWSCWLSQSFSTHIQLQITVRNWKNRIDVWKSYCWWFRNPARTPPKGWC